MLKKTVIIGASPNPARYAFMAAELLTSMKHEVIPVGVKKGMVAGKEILDIRTSPAIQDVDTVTLYVGPANQNGLYEYITLLKPKRVIFNPGTENRTLEEALEAKGIMPVEACTLVMLRTGQY